MRTSYWTIPMALVAIAGIAIGLSWIRTAKAGPAKAMPDIRAVVFHAPGPGWAAGVSFREQPGTQAHIAYYRTLLAQKKLFLGGRFLDDTGGMMIAAPGVTVDALKALAAEDPAVKSGFLTATVRPWMIGMRSE